MYKFKTKNLILFVDGTSAHLNWLLGLDLEICVEKMGSSV